MTIAVGILCDDGVVVGADREVSLGTHKVLEPKAHLLKRNNVAVGLVGAGSANLITLAAQELQRRLSDDMPLDAVKKVVDGAQEINRDHIQANPSAGHTLDLLLGIKTTPVGGRREVGLLKVDGTIVIWKERYDAVGVGYELAGYLLNGLYGNLKQMSVLRGIMLASMVIKQAKTLTKFTGGPSDIIHVRFGSVSDFVPEDDILLHENSAEKFASIIQPVLLAMADINVGNDKLQHMIDEMSAALNAFRPQAFLNAQRTRLPQPPERAQVLISAEEHSSMVFSIPETSAAASWDTSKTRK